jgi:hypothetical protein
MMASLCAPRNGGNRCIADSQTLGAKARRGPPS